MLHFFILFRSSWIFCSAFSLFSLHFTLESFYWPIFKFFFRCIASTNEPVKALLFLFAFLFYFLFLEFLWLFLRVSISLFTIHICSLCYILYPLKTYYSWFIKLFVWYSTSVSYLSIVLMFALSLQTVYLLPSGRLCTFFCCWKVDVLSNKIRVNSLWVWGFMLTWIRGGLC